MNEPKFIMQSMPNFDKEEADACYNYMMGDNFVTEYKQTTAFENELKTFIGSKHCIMTTSGTTAIILALLSLGIKQGDEVIVPDYTMIATINSVKIIGAVPIIIDVDKDTFTISTKEVKKYYTNRTKAVIHVSLNNRTKDIQHLNQFCKEKNIFLIEDSAQSLGCFYKNKHFGTFGNIGCFSLSTPKIISTGQGGFIVTDDDIVAEKAKMIKNFGRKTGGIDDFETFGINLKFTDLQAVIGLEQMKKINPRIKLYREIYDIYYSKLHKIVRMKKRDCEEWFPWFVDIYTDHRDELFTFLKENKIQTRKTYPSIHTTNMYKELCKHKTYPISEYVLCLQSSLYT